MNWCPIKDYEHLYKVSDTGQVKSSKGILKQTANKNTNYLCVSLWKCNVIVKITM